MMKNRIVNSYKWIVALLAIISVNIFECSAGRFNPNLNEYYVTANASSGSGSSWSDPMDFACMVENLPSLDHHCVFYMERGLYDFTKLDVDTLLLNQGFTLLGGYSPSNHAAPSTPSDLSIFKLGESESWAISLSGNDSVIARNVKFNSSCSDSIQCASTISIVTIQPVDASQWQSSKVSFDKCTFNQCRLALTSCYGKLSQCDFYCNEITRLQLSGSIPNHSFDVESSSFSGSNAFFTFGQKLNVNIINSTFCVEEGTRNDKPVIYVTDFFGGGDTISAVSIKHCTILGDIYSTYHNVEYDGNIIYGKYISALNITDPGKHQNVYLGAKENRESTNECFIPDSLLPKVFNYKDSAFIVSKGAGDFTRTIPLLADHFYANKNNHGSLRYLSHKVDRDQLGRERYEYPCFGAYEVPFNLRNKYYVKESGDGKMDGSDWGNALDTIAFNYLLPFAPAESEFHFAEGVYTPLGEDVKSDNKTHTQCYRVYNPISLIGGYSKNPSKYEKPDPSENETVFSGDIDYNDELGVKNGANSYSILALYPQKEGKINVSGIKFKGAYNAAKNFWQAAIVTEIPQTNNNCELNVEKCVFESNYHALFARRCILNLSDCLFDNSISMGVNQDSSHYMKINNSTFLNSGIAVMADVKDVAISNSTFTFNNMDIDIVQSDICKLVNNTVMDSLSIKGGFFMDASLVGNILNGKITMQDSAVESRYNLFFTELPSKKPFWASSLDTSTTYSNLLSAFESENDSLVIDYVKPSEMAESPFTPTSNLLTDTLANGISLRFPLKFTEVKEDQRHAVRSRMTCMGSFELGGKYPTPSIPSAFTPYSQNGKNDVFMPYNEVYIYNRYGQLICHSKEGWDGRYRGELVDPGIYLYAVVIENGDISKGTIEVIKSK